MECITKLLYEFALIYARRSGAYATRENFENMVQFGAFWCIF